MSSLPSRIDQFDQAPAFEHKIVHDQALLQACQQAGQPLVFTNGVFDLLHRGHVTYLARASALGAALVVAVNTDDSVRRLNKAPERPLNTTQDRMALLASLACVDIVTSFDEHTPYELIERIKPQIIVKGGDYDMNSLPETALVRTWGGHGVAIAFEHERSTTALVRKIRGA